MPSTVRASSWWGTAWAGAGRCVFAHSLHDRITAAIALSALSPVASWAEDGTLAGTAIWLIHGAEDALAPVREIQEMARALHKSRGKVKLTILSGRDHFILDELQHPELYQWLLEQAPLR